MVAEIAGDGSVEAASYEGDAPDDVEGCMLETAKDRAIEGYDADPVRITCQYSGSLTEVTQMLTTDWKLEAR